MRFAVRQGTLCCQAAILLAALALAQAPPPPVFRAGVALVKVDAQVEERRTRAVIADLTAADFAIFDDNQLQPAVYFAREEAPLDLILLLDISGSMRGILEQVADRAAAALRQLHEGDRVAAIVFATRPNVAQEFTTNFAAVPSWLEYAVQNRDAGIETAINRALLFTAGYIRKNARNARRAILILTDNVPTHFGPPVSDREVTESLYAADAVMNGLILAEHPGLTNLFKLHNGIYRFAGETGGEVIEASKPGDLLARMIGRIRTRYSIHYRMPAGRPNSFHRIRVELTKEAHRRYPQAVVRARTGYYSTYINTPER